MFRLFFIVIFTIIFAGNSLAYYSDIDTDNLEAGQISEMLKKNMYKNVSNVKDPSSGCQIVYVPYPSYSNYNQYYANNNVGAKNYPIYME